MAKQVLSDGHYEQVKNLVKEGKGRKEIQEFFKNHYRIDVPKHVIYCAKHALKKSGAVVPSKALAIVEKSKRPYKKRGAKVQQSIGGGPEAPSTDNIKSLIDQLRVELESYSAFVIKKVRIELLKAIGEARKKRIDVGEHVEEFAALEVEEI